MGIAVKTVGTVSDNTVKSTFEKPILKQKNAKLGVNVDVKLNKDKAINDRVAKEVYVEIDEDEALLSHTFTYLLSIKYIVGEDVVITRLAELVYKDGLTDKASIVLDKYLEAVQEEAGYLFARRVIDSIRSKFTSHLDWFSSRN